MKKDGQTDETDHLSERQQIGLLEVECIGLSFKVTICHTFYLRDA